MTLSFVRFKAYFCRTIDMADDYACVGQDHQHNALLQSVNS